jgi:alkylhydroperoxidase/carboxymuconolactone decarboxylase family protein YurZ
LGPAVIGAAKNILTISLKYAKERKAFGTTISEFGAIQHKLAEMAIRIFVAESMAWRVVGLIENQMTEDQMHGACLVSTLRRDGEEPEQLSNDLQLAGSGCRDRVLADLRSDQAEEGRTGGAYRPVGGCAPATSERSRQTRDRYKLGAVFEVKKKFRLRSTDMPQSLPKPIEKLRKLYPAVWKAFDELGNCCHEAGPLDEKSRRLVKLALSIGAGLEGATHSAVRNAYKAGITQAEIDHVALLAISTLGLPSATRAFTWIRDKRKR